MVRWLCSAMFLAVLAGSFSGYAPPAHGQQKGDCKKTTIRDPSPFLGNGGEIIVLADGSVWKVASYQYLYLYAYQPVAVVCPADGKLMLMDSLRPAAFDITPVK